MALSVQKPILRFVNAKCTAKFDTPFDIIKLRKHIPQSVFYETFNSALGFYFQLIDGPSVGNLIPPPPTVRNARGKNVYVRVYTSGKVLILGNITNDLAIQTLRKLQDVIRGAGREGGYWSYSDATVNIEAKQFSLVVASCIYNSRFNLEKFASFVKGDYNTEQFSGMTSKDCTAHVTKDNKTKIILRGKTNDDVWNLYSLIWDHHHEFVTTLKRPDIEALQNILGRSDSESYRCGYETAGSHKICYNKVKQPNTSCWRHIDMI